MRRSSSLPVLSSARLPRSVLRVVSIVLSLAACRVGKGVSDFKPAHAPDGITVRFKLVKHDERLQGELLAVRDSGLVVLHAGAVSILRYRDAASISFIGLSQSLRGGERFTQSDAREVSLVSRFPQGISAELEARLLAAYGQAGILVVAPK